MLTFTTGNLLEAEAEALVNTVNTVGVMGKGIALMFKEAFPENYWAYKAACDSGELQVGRVFATERMPAAGPRWIINFPTKKHWRRKARVEWIQSGLEDLRRFIADHDIRSIAIPPLGCGHGGLAWSQVRELIVSALDDLNEVDVIVYEPVREYQNVAKREGVEELSPARAMVAELVRRYWILGIECSLLEIQKLAWFLERTIEDLGLDDPLDLRFQANRYGPYADRLRHLLNSLDGSYLTCEVRIPDARPTDVIAFRDDKRDRVTAYLATEAREYSPALEGVTAIIDGFESPLGMELLATVDWLLSEEGVKPELSALREALRRWPGGPSAGERKLRLFDDRLLQLAVDRLHEHPRRTSIATG